MAIADGYVISSTDLEALHTSALASLQASAQTLPAVKWLNLRFDNPVKSSSVIALTRNIPIPDNFFIADVAVTAADHTGTVIVTLDNGNLIEPLTFTKTVSGGFQKFTRYYSVAEPLQFLSKGSELTVSLATTGTATASAVMVSIGLATFWRRY